MRNQYSQVIVSAAVDLSEKKDNNYYIKKMDKLTTSENKDYKEKKENNENKCINKGGNYITLKTKNYDDNISIIEVKLPDPYSIIEQPDRNKTIEYHINSKFKSPFADYINHSLTNKTSNFKSKFKEYKLLKEYNDHIHFTKTQKIWTFINKQI